MVKLDAPVLPSDGEVVNEMQTIAAVLLVALVDTGVDVGDGEGLPELCEAAESFECRRRARFWAKWSESNGQEDEREHKKTIGQGAWPKGSRSSPETRRWRRFELRTPPKSALQGALGMRMMSRGSPWSGGPRGVVGWSWGGRGLPEFG